MSGDFALICVLVARRGSQNDVYSSTDCLCLGNRSHRFPMVYDSSQAKVFLIGCCCLSILLNNRRCVLCIERTPHSTTSSFCRKHENMSDVEVKCADCVDLSAITNGFITEPRLSCILVISVAAPMMPSRHLRERLHRNPLAGVRWQQLE